MTPNISETVKIYYEHRLRSRMQALLPARKRVLPYA